MRAPGWKKLSIVVVALVFAAVLAACGGAGGGGDKGALESLRSDAEFAYGSETESIVRDALALADKNAGTPLGDEAYAFAEETFLTDAESGYASTFATGVAPVPDEASSTDSSLDSYPSILGFVAAVPAAYHARAVTVLQDKLTGEATDTLRKLEASVVDRRQWVAELQAAGSTSMSWDSGSYEWIAPVISYVRSVATQAELTPAALAGWDAIVNAVTLAQWAPSKTDFDVSGDVFTSTYTPAQVAEAVPHIDELEAAIAAARAVFPATAA